MRIPGFLAVFLLLVASHSSADQEKASDLAESANTIAQKALIVDTHIDVPYRLQKKWVDVTLATERTRKRRCQGWRN